MKALKTTFIGIALLLVIVIAAVAWLLKNLDSLVQDTIEDTGSRLTGTAVTLDSVALDLAAGSATLKGLVIDNPPGYATEYAFALDTIRVDIDPKSITGSAVRLDEVSITGARLNAEQKGTATNLSTILTHVRAASGEEAPPAEAGEPTEVRLALARFAFTDTKATLVTEQYGDAALRIPDVTRTGIGDPANGLAPAELASRLLEAVLAEAQAAVGSALADKARDAARDAAKDKLKDKLNLSDEDMDSAEGALKSLFQKD
ncbi:AsmA family protein [Pseudohaliea rubra]|uniref:Phage-related protein tail protein n=1 Tax=Pseudohaliea rubra DSM 19751 TaxID=1265313 RepID=A0A095X203_9GAMM|nr:hypothetical protein [Pseudohaliea rubra]KGE04914.1 Phage-related protein tail protein [Pseudohaliea rubra DSM 19751]